MHRDYKPPKIFAPNQILHYLRLKKGVYHILRLRHRNKLSRLSTFEAAKRSKRIWLKLLQQYFNVLLGTFNLLQLFLLY